VLNADLARDDGPLFHLCGPKAEFALRAAPAGWYVDITGIMEAHGLTRISRKKNWKVNAKSWEWWHYQFQPLPPPAGSPEEGAAPALYFGDYLQLYGVHEYKLRNLADGWADHSDIEYVLQSKSAP
jgi:hypothetical protein